MKSIRTIFCAAIGLVVIFYVLQVLVTFPVSESDDPVGPNLGLSPLFAAKQELKAGMIDPKTGKKIKYWQSPMDPTYIRKEPGKSPMGMDLVPVYEEEGEGEQSAATIRIDPVTMQDMGVRLGRVSKKPLIKNIRTIGYVTYDETKIFTVNTKFNGWIEKLYVDFVGDEIKEGQKLFDIYSPDLVSAQQEYLLALEQHKRLSGSSYRGIRQGAERLLEASRTRLRYWDLTDRQIQKIERTGKVQKTLTIYSPADGVVTQKYAFKGHYVKEGEHQYEIVDFSTMWVDVDIYEYELPWVQKGMEAEMELTYIPGKRFEGKVLFVYPYLDPKTRTAKLRLQFPNPDYVLKPGMYANIQLKSIIAREGLVIPQEAVIDTGTRKIVFVSLGKGKFQPRDVKLGLEVSKEEFQVLDGLKEGEEIVLSGQFLLDSESNLREAIQKMLELRERAPGGH